MKFDKLSALVAGIGLLFVCSNTYCQVPIDSKYPQVCVVNTTNYDIEAVIKFTLEYLEVENINIVVYEYEGVYYNIVYEGKGYVFKDENNTYKINLQKGLTNKVATHVVIHECVHIQQFWTNELYFENKNAWWYKGVYKSMRHEIDCETVASIIYKKWKIYIKPYIALKDN